MPHIWPQIRHGQRKRAVTDAAELQAVPAVIATQQAGQQQAHKWHWRTAECWSTRLQAHARP